MSLRKLSGVRIKGLGDPTIHPAFGSPDPAQRLRDQGIVGVAPEEVPLRTSPVEGPGVWTDVRTVQAGLAVIHADEPRIPSPGAVDGQWGPRTQASLEMYFDLSSRPSANVDIEQGTSGGTDRIKLPGDAVSDLTNAAAHYRRDMGDSGSDIIDAGDGGTLPVDGGALVPSNATVLSVRTRRRWPWWAWVLLALGVAGAGYGAWYWYKKSKRS